MASALKTGFQEGIDHHAGKSCADNPAAKAQNVGVVVQTGVFCAEAVGAAGSADSLDLVGSHRDADAGAAIRMPMSHSPLVILSQAALATSG